MTTILDYMDYIQPLKGWTHTDPTTVLLSLTNYLPNPGRVTKKSHTVTD
jgi:hypothetical protein